MKKPKGKKKGSKATKSKAMRKSNRAAEVEGDGDNGTAGALVIVG